MVVDRVRNTAARSA